MLNYELNINFESISAHCIQEKGSEKVRDANTGFLNVGKYDLKQKNETGSVRRRVKRFIIHNDWNPMDEKYDADIAIIVMSSPVVYSQNIKPLCIWEFSSDVTGHYGLPGHLAGNNHLLKPKKFASLF